MNTDPSDRLSLTFAALADPTRRTILTRLSEGDATVGELAEPLPISVQAVSKHLRVLERAGLITRSRSAQLRPSQLRAAPMKDAADWIRISRVFYAPRERVWREWTEPERFADWYGGPQCEVPRDSVSMDVRPGGNWRLTMFAPPDRRRIDWKGEYLEVVAPERLIFTVSDQRGDDAYELVKVVLTPLGDERTEMLFEQRGSMSPEQYERATDGWGGFFDRMAERLTTA